MSLKLKRTGELREFLVDMMIGVKSGVLDMDKARNITKLAAQINESFYSEAKIMKLRREAGEAMTALGDLPINRAE